MVGWHWRGDVRIAGTKVSRPEVLKNSQQVSIFPISSEKNFFQPKLFWHLHYIFWVSPRPGKQRVVAGTFFWPNMDAAATTITATTTATTTATAATSQLFLAASCTTLRIDSLELILNEKKLSPSFWLRFHSLRLFSFEFAAVRDFRIFQFLSPHWSQFFQILKHLSYKKDKKTVLSFRKLFYLVIVTEKE